MITYKAHFHGRLIGSIGLSHDITTEVAGADEDSARTALYERFEHISGLRLVRLDLSAGEAMEIDRDE